MNPTRCCLVSPGRNVPTVELPKADAQEQEPLRGRERSAPCILASVSAAPARTGRPDLPPAAPYFDCAPLSWAEKTQGTWLQNRLVALVKTYSLLFQFPKKKGGWINPLKTWFTLLFSGYQQWNGCRFQLLKSLSDLNPFPPSCLRSAVQSHLGSCWWSLCKHAAFCWLCQTPTNDWGNCSLILI